MIVVTGATGNVGRPLVRELVAAGERVTAISRSGSAQDVPAGVRYRQGDLGDPENLKPSFDGADALFLLTSGEFLASGDAGVLGEVIEAARAGGVGRVVLLSSQGVGTDRHPPELEEAVKASGLEWTVLRSGGFASNAFGWADMIREHRLVAAPFADVALPVIDPDDIAACADVVLREDGHADSTYVLTGPTPISPRQQAETFEKALGEPVRFTELTRDEAHAAMSRFMPEPVVESTLGILGSPVEVERRVSPDVERLLGRPPRAFAEWVERNVTAFK